MSFTSILLIAIALIVVWIVLIYNRLVSLKNQYANGFAQIDVQLKRRYDLIPNLVDTAKKYMQHEQETLTQIIEARNKAVSTEAKVAHNQDDDKNMQAFMSAEATLTQSMGKLFALVENYPDLKANQTMQQLMEELTSTENKIGFARQAYNDNVMAYNTSLEVFPNNILANMFRFTPTVYFKVENEAEKEPVKVDFN